MLKNKSLVFFAVVFVSLFNLMCRVNAQEIPLSPPFNAWISTDNNVFVLPSLERLGPSISLLRFGDPVRVVGCIPDCVSRNSWAQLYPQGIVRLSNLSTGPRTREAEFLGGPPDFTWAKVKRRGVVSRDNPSDHGGILESFSNGDELLFRTNALLQTQGYLERPNGGFVPVASLEIFEPSTFSGWQNPPDNFVFILNDTNITLPNRQVLPVLRYERFEAVSQNRTIATVSVMENERILSRRNTYVNGTIPRGDVRYGFKHNRPSTIPSGVRWVHVDLNQQVLTAYDHDDLVFATMVSTGRIRGSTHSGTFQVRRKITYTQMRGGGSRPYNVEGVRWTQYLTEINEDVALHESFWHNGFGRVRSHGCVNLSPADARFMFDFNPAEIPSGWRSIHPIALGIPNLWVIIE